MTLKQAIALSGLKKNFVAKKLNVNRCSLSAWIAGRTYPHHKNYKAIKNMFPAVDLRTLGARTDEVY